ncbi:MAG: patatin-like phospholipase family protein [Pseudomonadota bacterium]|nr:patatin-like phospholipase family protein [Pseudomonadota bacterium]
MATRRAPARSTTDLVKKRHAALPRPAVSAKRKAAAAHEECILVLQGGGALGAYQAGVFEALSAMQQAPDWVAGMSIGAINAALIAGNAPERRVDRLREFWEGVSSSPFATPALPANLHRLDGARDAVNESSATMAMLFGVAGFFVPRIPAAPFQAPGTLAAISYYDTAPLQATLERLIDFDLLNSGRVRLSVGAVNVTQGNFKYFDTADRRHPLDTRHIMASGALPPGFPPIEIDGEFYWDGGIVSNTPLQYVLDQPGRRERLIFQVDLFAAKGAMPANLAEANEREKDIRFSSRTRLNTSFELRRQATLQAAKRLVAKLPANLRDDPDARALAALPAEAAVSVVHLIYRSKHYESQSKDYEFSRASMLEHWSAGMADTQATLEDPRWLRRPLPEHGVHVYDFLSGSGAAEKTVTPTTISRTLAT